MVNDTMFVQLIVRQNTYFKSNMDYARKQVP